MTPPPVRGRRLFRIIGRRAVAPVPNVRTPARRRALHVAVPLVLAAAGCAWGVGNGDSGSSRFATDLGRVLRAPLERAREKVWTLARYPLLRSEVSSTSLYWESEWVPRPPGSGEEEGGVLAGRTRLLLRGRRVGENLDGSAIYSVRFEAEHQGRSAAVPDWHPRPLPDDLLEALRALALDLEMEVRAGMRR